MGLVAGLNMSSITRLKFTHSLLTDRQTEEMQELFSLMAPSRSYKTYRAHIADAQRPIIPYL